MSNDNGGPAFPSAEFDPASGVVSVAHTGMSLRDYFAAKAMQGVFTSPVDSTDEGKRYMARHAYKMADAMLAERAAIAKATGAEGAR